MTTRDLAVWLRCAPATVAYWRHIGRGPRSVKVGHLARYRRDDAEAWLESGARGGDRR